MKECMIASGSSFYLDKLASSQLQEPCFLFLISQVSDCVCSASESECRCILTRKQELAMLNCPLVGMYCMFACCPVTD